MRNTRLAIIAVVVLLLAAGCSNSDDEGASASSTTSAGETAGLEGEPIELMWIGPLTGSVVQPESRAGAKAAALAINEAGGLDGRPLVITECDEAQDPAKNEECARELVDSKAIATVGQFARGSNALIKAETANKIPAVGIIAINDDSLAESTASFSYSANGYGILACAKAMSDSGVKNIGTMVIDVDAAKQLSAGTKVVVANIPDATFTGEITTDVGNMDFAAPIQNAIDQGAEGLVIAYPEQESAALVQANAGRLELCHAEGALGEGQLRKLGDAADGFRVNSALPVNSELPDSELGQQYLDEMAAYQSATDDPGADPEVLKPGTALNAWMAVYAFKQVAEKLPEISRESVFEAFTNETALTFDGLLDAPVDFTQFQELPQLARVFNPNYKTYVWDAQEGAFVRDGDEVYNPIDLILGKAG